MKQALAGTIPSIPVSNQNEYKNIMLNDSVSKKSVVVRWFTLIGIISGIFILLLALEALVTGEKHPPIVSAAGDLESWSIITCPPVFPSFEDRGMNGWSASGSSSRCWQYAEGGDWYQWTNLFWDSTRHQF
ncbi:MAG: hypothetical protein M5U34_04610 [Chloroflexi bacterium]|nr:hypothetical protein [Chloroflexota bacterium]